MKDTPAKRGLQTAPTASAGQKPPATKRTPLVAPVIPVTKPLSLGQQLLKYRVQMVLGALFFLLVGALVAFWPSGRVNHMKQLGQEFSSDNFKDLSDDEKKAKFNEMRELRKHLTPEEQAVLQREREAKELEKMKPLFEMSKEDRDKVLDEMIEKAEQQKADREARRAAFGNGGFGQGGAQGGRGQQANNQNVNAINNAANALAGQNGSQGGSNLSPGQQAQRENDRNTQQKVMLSLMNPELRSMRQQFTYEMNQRRHDQGLPPIGGFGGFGGGGFGGGGRPPGGPP